MVDCSTIKTSKTIKMCVINVVRLLEQGVDIERVKRKPIVPQANEVAKERTKEELSTQLVTRLLRKFERTVEYLM